MIVQCIRNLKDILQTQSLGTGIIIFMPKIRIHQDHGRASLGPNASIENILKRCPKEFTKNPKSLNQITVIVECKFCPENHYLEVTLKSKHSKKYPAYVGIISEGKEEGTFYF
jgi:hypothetical protein